MTIDRSGEWWKGTEAADIGPFLRELKSGGYAVDRVIQAICQCGSTQFGLLFVDSEEELAKTVCAKCSREAFIADSEDLGRGIPSPLKCPCGLAEYEVALGLCVRGDTWVRWMSIGARCLRSGDLGSPLDWKSDLELTDPAATRVG